MKIDTEKSIPGVKAEVVLLRCSNISEIKSTSIQAVEVS